MANLSSAPLTIMRMSSSDDDFRAQLDKLIEWSVTSDDALDASVKDILVSVADRGDAALLEFTQRFDAYPAQTIDELIVDPESIQSALNTLDASTRGALEQAASRIHDFHLHQKQESWQFTDDAGVVLGQQVTAIERVGIYVPGGKAAYPSSVLMNAIPARVAGVDQIVMVSPAPAGEMNPAVLAAAAIAGIDTVFKIGGAQAIAALAYGTDTVPKVDKIVGPGNRFVACAKKMVFGQVGLDMLAGPSEILVICDGKTEPDWVAMDLFSQAEHDEDAQALLVCPDSAFLDAVEASMNKLLPSLERRDIIAQSIANRTAFIAVDDVSQAIDVANLVAPEHLELSVDEPQTWLSSIRNAGAIFMGRHTPESFGDYCAGPSHVLPTSATARFASPLGVYDFQKRSSIIQCSPQSAIAMGRVASVLARSESFTAHARSAEMRIPK